MQDDLPVGPRLAPLKYFNLFRLIIAGLFVVAGREMGLGGEAPNVFLGMALAYLGAALAFGFPDAIRRFGLDRLITLQLVIDIIALTAIMWISGGFKSGLQVLMMVYLAGAGLISEGRTSLFIAALATLGVLAENFWRFYTGIDAVEFLQVGISCAGFFAIAITSRLLARRARFNEDLAAERGALLGRQKAINERIIEDMRDGVIVMGEGGTVRQANPRASALLGMKLEPGTRLVAADVWFADCARSFGSEGSVRRLGPAAKLLRCRAVSAKPKGGGDTLIYLTDYEEIQEQVQQLKLAALGRLTASMAHEIRNPLSAVTQAADLLGEEKRTEVQARLTRIINDNARRIERLVREVLALGRRENILTQALPLAEMVAEVVEEFALGGKQASETFSCDIDPQTSFAADRAHIHQILVNLLGNARRYASGKPGSVRVFSYELAEGRVALHVVDDGPGVAPGRQAEIFEPFFTTDSKGTGLGLYIARELAEANGARLEFVGNEPGAHFVLTGRSQP